jgi:mono/diheme cytochrome c family protein
MKLLFPVLLSVLSIAYPTEVPAQSDWRAHVPEPSRTLANPLQADADAPLAGAKLYRHDCASCHGSNAQGRGSRPGLRTDRVKSATDGELQWLLKNGSLAHGMPSWSRLPEAQRWQIVRYLRTLPMPEAAVRP